MRAVICRQFGDPGSLSVEDIPSPKPAPGQVRLTIAAAGLNFADTLMVAGKYQEKPPFPFVPGLEAAGTVREVGAGVTGIKPGDRVIALLGTGAFAEEAVASVGDLYPIPERMDFVTAAGFPVAYGTSELGLSHRGRLQAGETLLVLGAAGGVGLT